MAETVAKELGYHFVDKHSIGRILASYGLVTFSEEYESTLGFWASFDGRIKEMFGMLDRVTRSIARHGNSVILGRGSFAVLCGFVDVLNVRIKAPFESRVNRTMTENAVAERSKAELDGARRRPDQELLRAVDVRPSLGRELVLRHRRRHGKDLARRRLGFHRRRGAGTGETSSSGAPAHRISRRTRPSIRRFWKSWAAPRFTLLARLLVRTPGWIDFRTLPRRSSPTLRAPALPRSSASRSVRPPWWSTGRPRRWRT